MKGVKNGPSPAWMQKRLKAIGLRPINALVDITNYITFDRGRPLHVFDAAKVHGNLTVRRARDGEELLALDGRSYKLDDAICVIADEQGVESLSGVMGGEATGCDENTTDVLIESALWVPNNIAQTGRKLGINTDARYRFERGVDPAFNNPGAELATKLVMEFCGGEPSELIVVGDATADAERDRLPGQRSRAPLRPRCAGSASLRDADRAWLQGRWRGRARESDAAVLASGCRRQSGSGGRSRAHRWRRQHPADAVRSRRRAAQAGAHVDPDAHTQGQARIGGAWVDRGGDVVVRLGRTGEALWRRRPVARAR